MMLDQGVFYARAKWRSVHESPAQSIERDLAAGKIDLAIVWGPIAGFLAGRHAD